jgi:anti-anti-sigma factor
MAIALNIKEKRGIMMLRDRLTFADAGEFRNSLFSMMDGGVSTIEIDLIDLKFCDSAGLGMLMVAHKECGQRNIALSLLRPKGDVKSLLELTKSYERFTIVP